MRPRRGDGLGLRARLGALVFSLVAAPAVADSVLPIAPGVEAQLGISETGIRSAARVRIAPPRRRGEPPPELGPLLTSAYDWCAGNVPNGFENEFSGFDTRHGCDIDVDAGVYRIRDTVVLRQRLGQQVPIRIDLRSTTLIHMPDPPRAVRVQELAKLPCTAATQGSYVNVVDADDYDTLDRADREGSVPITRIGPNTGRTPGCPAGGVICKFGGQVIRVETRGPHGLVDGGLLDLGDVVELAVPGTDYDKARILVKEIVSPTVFLASTDRPSQTVATQGSVRETATTAWCNGASWRPGKPMLAIGGPGASTKTRTRVDGGTFAFDLMLYRTTAILIDGEVAPNGRGGAEWVTLADIAHVGSTGNRGQIVVATGTPHVARNFCGGIDVEVSSDSLPGSWSPAVWNQSCGTSRVRIRQHHGGGVWWGLDEPAFQGPTFGSLSGYVEGCRDGPCLWLRSGQLLLADGFKAWGSVWGPQGETHGPSAGRVAILGSARGLPVNLVAHGATWGAGQDSDLDCYVVLGKVSHFVQSGGYMLSGNAGVGDGDEFLFCAADARPGDFSIEHVEQHAWDGGKPRILGPGVR